MSLRLVQIESGGERCVAALVDAERAERLADAPSVYALAVAAMADGVSLAQAVERARSARHV